MVRALGMQVRDMANKPRITCLRALRSEFLKLLRSPLAAAHLACAVVAGLACGAYFALAPWDPSLGTDAYVQFLGALMPLMAGIVCGVAVDEERRAGHLANLLSPTSRRIAVVAKLAALVLMAAAALAGALALFAGALSLSGRPGVGAVPLLVAWGGSVLGSLPLYVLFLAIALRFGRNVTIGAGAAGLILAFFSVGGLAHGLMTGELTALASSGLLSVEPLAWPARLGSLAVEWSIASARDLAGVAAEAVSDAAALTCVCIGTSALATLALVRWFSVFEEGKDHA